MYRKAAEVSKLRIFNEATSSWPFDLVEWTGWEETFRRLLSVAEQAVDGKPPGRAMKLPPPWPAEAFDAAGAGAIQIRLDSS